MNKSINCSQSKNILCMVKCRRRQDSQMPLIRAFSKEFFLSVLRYNYKFHFVHAQHKLNNSDQQGFALCANKKAQFSLMSVEHLPECRNKQQGCYIW
jgi:hypothetical protein